MELTMVRPETDWSVNARSADDASSAVKIMLERQGKPGQPNESMYAAQKRNVSVALLQRLYHHPPRPRVSSSVAVSFLYGRG